MNGGRGGEGGTAVFQAALVVHEPLCYFWHPRRPTTRRSRAAELRTSRRRWREQAAGGAGRRTPGDGVQMRVHGVGERRRKTEQAPGRAAQLLDFLIEVPAAHPSGARSVAELARGRTRQHNGNDNDACGGGGKGGGSDPPELCR